MTEDLERTLTEAAKRRDEHTHRPRFFDARVEADRTALAALARDPAVIVIDTLASQLDELVRSRTPKEELEANEARTRIGALLAPDVPMTSFGAWVYYPWLNRVVHVLPEPMHRELRLDRNRYKITAEEQSRLLRLRVGIAGLSVGRSVASTLVREGIGGELRLADFDTLSLSNLNRVPGGLVDVGLNKAVLAAREIAELDPYLSVAILPKGVEDSTLDAFLTGLDVLVDECDDFAIKLLLRERARALGLPVVMATSDRGMLDIERFDLEPARPPFHGLLEGIGSAELRGLTTKQKIPYILRVLEAERLDPRMAASLIEVKETLSTWPQLASGVVLGGAMVASALRRIALGELSQSGRYHADLETLIADGHEAPRPPSRPFHPEAAAVGPPAIAFPATVSSAAGSRPTRDEMRFIVACSTLAPSGGNIQPWRFTAANGTLRCAVDEQRSRSLTNFAERGTYIALGAALEAAVIGARTLGFAATEVQPSSGAVWELMLERVGDRAPSHDFDLLRARCCNRRTEMSDPIDRAATDAIVARAAPLASVQVARDALPRLGHALGVADRARFMSPKFRPELFDEIRFSREEAIAARDGLDVASLELDATDLAVLEVLRSGGAMDLLTRLGHGRALENAARTWFGNAGAALMIGSKGTDPSSLVAAGRGLLRLWLEATRRGVGVHPWGTPLLFQRLLEAEATLDPWEREALAVGAEAFAREVTFEKGVTPLLVLRLTKGREPTARSLRRNVDDVLVFADV